MVGVESEFQICRAWLSWNTGKLSSPTPRLVLLKKLRPQRGQGAPCPVLGSSLPLRALLKSHTQIPCYSRDCQQHSDFCDGIKWLLENKLGHRYHFLVPAPTLNIVQEVPCRAQPKVPAAHIGSPDAGEYWTKRVSAPRPRWSGVTPPHPEKWPLHPIRCFLDFISFQFVAETFFRSPENWIFSKSRYAVSSGCPSYTCLFAPLHSRLVKQEFLTQMILKSCTWRSSSLL